MCNKFSFVEDEQKEIINIYENAISEVNTSTDTLVSELIDVCKNTKYKPIVDFTENVIKFYNEELKEIISKHYDKWIQSGSSLSNFINTMEGGEEAVKVAKNLEQRLKDQIDQLKINSENIKYDTSQVEISEDNYETLKESINDYISNIYEIKENLASEIKSKAEDNLAFLSIEGVITETLSSIKNAFEKFTSIINEGREKFNEKLNLNKGRASEFKADLEKKVGDSSEAFKSLASMFKL